LHAELPGNAARAANADVIIRLAMVGGHRGRLET
jgi:hypothetical protein